MRASWKALLTNATAEHISLAPGACTHVPSFSKVVLGFVEHTARNLPGLVRDFTHLPKNTEWGSNIDPKVGLSAGIEVLETGVPTANTTDQDGNEDQHKDFVFAVHFYIDRRCTVQASLQGKEGPVVYLSTPMVLNTQALSLKQVTRGSVRTHTQTIGDGSQQPTATAGHTTSTPRPVCFNSTLSLELVILKPFITKVGVFDDEPRFTMSWAPPNQLLNNTPPAMDLCPRNIAVRAAQQDRRALLGFLQASVLPDGQHRVVFGALSQRSEQDGYAGPAVDRIIAWDHLNVSSIHVAGPGIRRLGDGVNYHVPPDYREMVTFRAMNMLGRTASCTCTVTTFTTSLEWHQNKSTVGMAGENVASPGSMHTAEHVHANAGSDSGGKIHVYYKDTTYDVFGPQKYGFTKENLFEAAAGETGDVTFKIKLLPKADGLAYIDQQTGDIIISPRASNVGTTYSIELVGRDTSSAEALVNSWNFTVQVRPAFRVVSHTRALSNTSVSQNTEVVNNVTQRATDYFVVGKPFQFAPVNLTRVVNGKKDNCTFTLSGNATTKNSLFINPQTGAVQGIVETEQTSRLVLLAIDQYGASAVVENVSLRFKKKDTDTPSFGPNGLPCTHGKATDVSGSLFDEVYSCDCGATKYRGPNCEILQATNDSGAVVAGILVPIILLITLTAVVMKYQAYKKANAPADFTAQFQALVDKGELEADAVKTLIPRELTRSWLKLEDRIGSGNFGEVWKGLLDDKAHSQVPEYLVAAKTALPSTAPDSAAAREDLLQEATVMATVGQHQHLVSLIGVCVLCLSPSLPAAPYPQRLPSPLLSFQQLPSSRLLLLQPFPVLLPALCVASFSAAVYLSAVPIFLRRSDHARRPLGDCGTLLHLLLRARAVRTQLAVSANQG